MSFIKIEVAYNYVRHWTFSSERLVQSFKAAMFSLEYISYRHRSVEVGKNAD